MNEFIVKTASLWHEVSLYKCPVHSIQGTLLDIRIWTAAPTLFEGGQCTVQTHIRYFINKTDLEYVAQNTHGSKHLRYLVCILCTLCNTGTRWAIVEVFDRVHLKLNGPGKQR